MGTGRPEEYTPEIAQEFCARLTDGRSMRSICEDEDMPGRRTIYDWLQRHPEFVLIYDRAIEARADTHHEELFEIADDARNDWMERADPKNPGWIQNGEAVNRSRLRVDVRKWSAARMKAKRYGDRLELGGKDGGPLIVEVVKFGSPKDE